MRTKKTVVILISGKAGSGKTTVKDILKAKLESIPSINVFPYSFANPLKYMALAFFGWDKEKDERGRHLLQQIGAVGREYDGDIWVKHFLNQLDKDKGVFPPNFAIIDDWRFPNELAYLQKNPLLNTITIRVFGRGGLEGNTASDVSENSLPEVDHEILGATGKGLYNFQISNEKDIELLEHKLDIILAEIEKQYIVE